jgi:ribonuclease J
MIALTRPKFFLPVHGEHRMLVKHSQTAQSMGIPAENMVIIQNGDAVGLTTEEIKVSGKVPAGIELVDTSGIGIVSGKVLQERQQMAADGIVTIAAAIDWNGKLITKPDIHLRGVVTTIDRDFLQKWAHEQIEQILSDRWADFAQSFDGQPVEIDWAGLQAQLEKDLQRAIRRELQCQPTVTLLMPTPEEPVKAADGRRRRRTTAAPVAS